MLPPFSISPDTKGASPAYPTFQLKRKGRSHPSCAGCRLKEAPAQFCERLGRPDISENLACAYFRVTRVNLVVKPPENRSTRTWSGFPQVCTKHRLFCEALSSFHGGSESGSLLLSDGQTKLGITVCKRYLVLGPLECVQNLEEEESVEAFLLGGYRAQIMHTSFLISNTLMS